MGDDKGGDYKLKFYGSGCDKSRNKCKRIVFKKLSK